MKTMQKSSVWISALAVCTLLIPCFAAEHRESPGYLGVRIESLDRKDKQETGVTFGVRVAEVEKDSPAQKAGVREKDIIQTFGGEKIRAPGELVSRVRKAAPDSTVSVGLIRDKAPVQVRVKLVKVPRSGFEQKIVLRRGGGHPRLGVKIHALNDGLAGYFGVSADEGALILDADDDGPAMKAGIRPGDVIVRIGKEKVFEPGDVTDILKEYKAEDKADVAVVRKGRESVFSVTLGKFSENNILDRFLPGDPQKIRVIKNGSCDPETIGDEQTVITKILKDCPDKTRQDLEALGECFSAGTDYGDMEFECGPGAARECCDI